MRNIITILAFEFKLNALNSLVLEKKDLEVPLVSSTEVLAIKTIEYANHLTIKRNYNKE